MVSLGFVVSVFHAAFINLFTALLWSLNNFKASALKSTKTCELEGQSENSTPLCTPPYTRYLFLPRNKASNSLAPKCMYHVLIWCDLWTIKMPCRSPAGFTVCERVDRAVCYLSNNSVEMFDIPFYLHRSHSCSSDLVHYIVVSSSCSLTLHLSYGSTALKASYQRCNVIVLFV